MLVLVLDGGVDMDVDVDVYLVRFCKLGLPSRGSRVWMGV